LRPQKKNDAHSTADSSRYINNNFEVGPPGYFTRISLTMPIASALKKQFQKPNGRYRT
jgi:hypothetical protein